MTDVPRIGALVTHRNLGTQTIYRVLRPNPDCPSTSMVIQYVYGVRTHMEMHTSWNAAVDNLMYAEPAALVLPLGA